jgi:hypothetical protein
VKSPRQQSQPASQSRSEGSSDDDAPF